MEPTEATNSNVLFTVPNPFTIYNPVAQRFATRHGNDEVRMSKPVVDGYCFMTLVEQVQGTNKIRFCLDNGAVVFRASSNSNLHSRFGNDKGTDTLFELIPRHDGTFYMRADNGNYVSYYTSSGPVLRASKPQPDQFCVFLIREPNNSGNSDIQKASSAYENEAEIAAAQVEI
ncbi:hypothetical protein BGZ96_004033 [Linnemannia gamsii]|uniref:Uncharacterized protein n=1 Tax=Linnemannia gamsii TaxID=64522 RepID=A0ABQ7JIN8_9FUNG|nr:hypothetical protein BGZ96_004033 [Linnemannia gamsii]